MPESMEAILSELAQLREAGTAVQWSVADLMARAMALTRPKTRGRGSMMGKLAEIYGCSKRWVQLLAQTGAEFPNEERHPDVPFTLYVTATRHIKPRAALAMALHEGMSTSQLENWIRKDTNGVDAPAGEICPSCGRPMPRTRGVR